MNFHVIRIAVALTVSLKCEICVHFIDQFDYYSLHFQIHTHTQKKNLVKILANFCATNTPRNLS